MKEMISDIHLIATPFRWIRDLFMTVAFIVIAPIAVVVWSIYCLLTGTSLFDDGTKETLSIFFRVFMAVGVVALPFMALFLFICGASISARCTAVLWLGVLFSLGFLYLKQIHEHHVELRTTYKTPIENMPSLKLHYHEPQAAAMRMLSVASCNDGSCPYFEFVHCGDEAISGDGTVTFRKGRLARWNMNFQTATEEKYEGRHWTNQKRLACIRQTVESRFGVMTDTQFGWAWNNGKEQVSLEPIGTTGNFSVQYSSDFYIDSKTGLPVSVD